MARSQNQIIYIGNFKPSFSTENDVKKAFEAIGWKVKTIQEDAWFSNKEILDIQNDYKFLLFTRTWPSSQELYRELLSEISIPTVSLHLDLYFGLKRGADIDIDSFFKSDYTFSADGGHQKEFKKMGINHIWMPPAVNDEYCYLGEEKELDFDVCFVGSYHYHDEWPYRPFLINWLKQTYGDKFRLLPQGEVIREHKLNNLYNSVKIVVGDSTYSPYYWSDRIPETLGRGGFLIHPKVEGLDDYFTPYKHYMPYECGNMKQLKMIIDYYLEHPNKRNKIRKAGQKHVKENHTYIQRVKFILKTLGYE